MIIERYILDTVNCSIVTIMPPHIAREDGGHIVIVCKNYSDVSYEDIPEEIAIELSILSRLTGSALKKALIKDNIEVGIVNYQINGNWSVNTDKKDPLHLHVYGRAKNSKNQKYGEALYLPKPTTGFYNNYTGLSDSDINCIRKYIINGLKNKSGVILYD